MVAWVAVASGGCTSSTQRTEVNLGQHPQSFKKEIRMAVRADYLLYLPKAYGTPGTSWPLLLFLHGAGERGDDVSQVELHGPPKLVAKGRREFPFVMVSPQCPAGEGWSGELQMDTLNALLDDVVSRYRIDTERIYVTGLSMGGFGTWRLAAAYPDRFAAIAPICGGGRPGDAARLAHLPIWVFHGAKDATVQIKESEAMVAALERVGGNVKFTVYPGAGHDSWTATYENPELYAWFLRHTRSGNVQETMTASPGKPDAADGN